MKVNDVILTVSLYLCWIFRSRGYVNTRTCENAILCLSRSERASWGMKLSLPVALHDAPSTTSITRLNSSGENALSGMIQCIKACLFVLERGAVQIYAQQLALLKFKCDTERFVAWSHCFRSRKTNTAVLWINISTILLKIVLNARIHYIPECAENASWSPFVKSHNSHFSKHTGNHPIKMFHAGFETIRIWRYSYSIWKEFLYMYTHWMSLGPDVHHQL